MNLKVTELIKKMKKTDKMLFMLAAGVVLVLLAWPSGGGTAETPVPESVSDSSGSSSYEEEIERRLKDILSKVEGAGTVEVMVTLKASEEKVVQSNNSSTEKTVDETDSNGGTRKQNESSYTSDTLTVGGSSGSGTPYVVKELMPEVEGILVLADGADKAVIKSEIIGAIQALFPLEAHKIRVLKRGS